LANVTSEWEGARRPRWLAPAIVIAAGSLLGKTASADEAVAKTAPRWVAAYERDGVATVRNLRALPRVWLVSEVRTLTPANVLKAIRGEARELFDPRQTALLEVDEGELPRVDAPASPTDSARLVSYSDGHLVVETRSASRAFLVVSESYFPGWEATVDGRAANIYQTNYVLQGVAVPAGSHRVELHFRTAGAALGSLISLGTFAVLVGMMVYSRRRRPRHETTPSPTEESEHRMSNQHGGFPQTPGFPKPSTASATPAATPQASVAAPEISAPAVATPEPEKPVEVDTPQATPRTRAPIPPAYRIGVAAGLGGTILGFIIGLAVGGSSSKSEQRPATPDGETEQRAASGAATGDSPSKGITKIGSEVAVDLGTSDDLVTMTGPWTAVSWGQRTASRTSATAALGLHLSPGAGTYALAVIARGDQDKLPVGIRVNGSDVGQWTVGREWSMAASVLEPGVMKEGANSVEFVLAEPAKDKPAAFMIDTLHLGPLQARASADLGLPNPRGALISGFYGREGEGESALSWSAGQRTHVGLLLKPLKSPYEVELTASAFGPLAPLGVEAFVNGKSIGSVKVEKAQPYKFRAPADTFVNGFNLVELVYEKTTKPSEVDKKSKDMRDLAIRLSRVTATPASQ
jgi:hypothetical protein